MQGDLLIDLENSKTALVEVSEYALGWVKEQILPLQNQEAGNIKERVVEISKKVDGFRTEFQEHCPYHVEATSAEVIDEAYDTISKYY